MLGRFTDLVVRYRRVVLALAGLSVVAAGLASLGLESRLTSGWGDWDDQGSANVAARQVIERTTGIDTQQGYVLLVRTDQPLASSMPEPPVVREAVDLLRHRPEVRQVLDYRSANNAALVSADGRSTLVIGEVGPVDAGTAVPQLQGQIDSSPLLAGHVELGGSTAASAEVMSVVLEDLTFAEMIVFPLLLVLLIIVFRGVMAALVPLIGGGVAVLVTVLAMRIILEFVSMSVFGLNLVFALGLGLSVDFSLLIVSRYREQLRHAGNATLALRDTMNTAGRTVLFSGLTVGSALIGLLVFPQRFLYSMGICGIVVVGAAVLYAVVVLPALLTVLGRRIEFLAPRRWQRRAEQAGAPDPAEARWRRIANAVIGRPGRAATVAAALLLILASPLLGVTFTAVQSANTLPDNASAGHVAEVMNRDFAVPLSDQEQIVISAPPTAEPAIASYAGTLRSIGGVGDMRVPRPLDAGHWLIQITLGGQPNTAGTQETMREVEEVGSAYPVSFTGATADGLALDADLGRHLPAAALILIVATLVMLFAMTGSVVLPVKAVIMNFLSLGAALGVVVFIFQFGHFAHLLGTTGQGALESTSPIVLAAAGFGLSTDYGVFLLGRIKEGREAGLSNRSAVASGIEHTGRIVTSAAALFCLSMCAMVLGRLAFAKELGFGAALAVVLDATIVRAILVPALMTLLGGLNWWAPKPLRILHSRSGAFLSGRTARRGAGGATGTPPIPTTDREKERK